MNDPTTTLPYPEIETESVPFGFHGIDRGADEIEEHPANDIVGRCGVILKRVGYFVCGSYCAAISLMAFDNPNPNGDVFLRVLGLSVAVWCFWGGIVGDLCWCYPYFTNGSQFHMSYLYD